MAYNSETKKWTATCEITDTQYGLQILPDISGEDDMWSNKMASVSGDEGSENSIGTAAPGQQTFRSLNPGPT